jgi:FixJ family two-component response regulator
MPPHKIYRFSFSTTLTQEVVRSMTTTIHIVDEDMTVAHEIAELLQPHGFDCRGFHSAPEYLQALNPQSQSISLISFGLFAPHNNDILDLIHKAKTSSTIIMTSDGAGTSKIVEAIKAGADDVIEKPFSCDHLISVIRRILATPMQCAVPQQDLPSKIASRLTDEEQEIIALMEQGVTVKQIAAKLDISIRTVHYRKASILEKMECKTCTEVISKISALRATGNVPRPHLPQFNTNPFGQTA